MSEKKKVLFAPYYDIFGPRAMPHIQRLQEKGFEVICNPLNRFYTEEELCDALQGVWGTMAAAEPYTERVFQAAKDLRIISRWGVGYDYVDVAAATRHGVLVAMAFGGNHEAVADATLALMGALGENVVKHHLQMKKTGWGGDVHPGLWRLTVGIVGLGRIGKAVARRCRGFEMRILAHTRTPDPNYARENGISLVSLDTLLREADYVTLHVPYTPETEKLMNRERLSLMKPTAFLINTSRGGLLDEEALYDVLAAREIAGAALDNYRGKPPIVSPLLSLDNIILSPHSAGNNLSAEALVGNLCVNAISAFAEGRGPERQYLLNPEVLQPRPTGISHCVA